MSNHDSPSRVADTTSPSLETALPPSSPASPISGRWRWQLRLRTFLLLVAVCGAWVIYFTNRHQIDVLQRDIAALRPLVREMRILDPGRLTVVLLEPLWYDDSRWDVYLPAGEYRLCLGTRQVESQQNANGPLPPIAKSRPLPPGRFKLGLDLEKLPNAWKVTVRRDDEVWLVAEEPLDWNVGFGSSGGARFTQSESPAVDQPVLLFHRRFSVPDGTGAYNVPTGPTPGIALWIEPQP